MWPKTRIVDGIVLVSRSLRRGLERSFPCPLMSREMFSRANNKSIMMEQHFYTRLSSSVTLRTYNRATDTLDTDRLWSSLNGEDSRGNNIMVQEQKDSHRQHHNSTNNRQRHLKQPSKQRQRRTSHKHHQNNNNNNNHNESFAASPAPVSPFLDKRLPCRQHLDSSNGDLHLPSSSWVHVDGTLPLSSLDEVVSSIEDILYNELTSPNGVVDLDAMWNPMQAEQIPKVKLVTSDGDQGIKIEETTGDSSDSNTLTAEPFRVKAAHIVLSPFGRPSGWHLQLANASMVYALLQRAQSRQRVRIGWKMVLVNEYHPSSSLDDENDNQHKNRIDDDILVDDTMVRFENCPYSLDEEHLRNLLSRYELARSGPTVIRWKGKTNDGKSQHMFVVRFYTPAWARAAVREKQNMSIGHKLVRLIQYPKQRLAADDTMNI